MQQTPTHRDNPITDMAIGWSPCTRTNKCIQTRGHVFQPNYKIVVPKGIIILWQTKPGTQTYRCILRPVTPSSSPSSACRLTYRCILRPVSPPSSSPSSACRLTYRYILPPVSPPSSSPSSACRLTYRCILPPVSPPSSSPSSACRSFHRLLVWNRKLLAPAWQELLCRRRKE